MEAVYGGDNERAKEEGRGDEEGAPTGNREMNSNDRFWRKQDVVWKEV